ncbi:hypothetical protein EDD85DRAFT_971328 [Armillaria nabsnona]|nr:hypothetical protein EDD85DRAFT_971328 [Armillaria nabsnona]
MQLSLIHTRFLQKMATRESTDYKAMAVLEEGEKSQSRNRTDDHELEVGPNWPAWAWQLLQRDSHLRTLCLTCRPSLSRSLPAVKHPLNSSPRLSNVNSALAHCFLTLQTLFRGETLKWTAVDSAWKLLIEGQYNFVGGRQDRRRENVSHSLRGFTAVRGAKWSSFQEIEDQRESLPIIVSKRASHSSQYSIIIASPRQSLDDTDTYQALRNN